LALGGSFEAERMLPYQVEEEPDEKKGEKTEEK
jgi:hypothetical protein